MDILSETEKTEIIYEAVKLQKDVIYFKKGF
jgi:hypothetical protein